MKFPLDCKDSFDSSFIFWLTRYVKFKLSSLSNKELRDSKALASVNLKPDGDFGAEVFERLKGKLLIFEVGKRAFVLRSMEIVQENGVYKFYDASVLFYMEDALLK